jgi:hypothetical protein
MATAAQLIARVKVEGLNTFKADMAAAGRSVTNAGTAALSAGNAILGLAKGLAIAGAAAAAVGGVVGKFAVESAVEFDTMTRKFEAFLGSAEEAKRTMAFIQNLAGPSLFETKDLAKAGTLLAAYGLNVQKVLPLADKLAAAMGDTGESVSEVARVFGRLKAGDFGEAFERLRDFGISFDDLREKGLKFSKSNEFLGTKLQALAAVSSIIDDRFSRISQVMASSPAAKFASAMDTARRAAVQAGNVFLTILVPAVEKMTRLLNFLVDKGIFASIASGVTSAGDAFSKTFGRTIMRGVFLFIATLQELPTIIKDVFTVISAIIDRSPLLKIITKLVGFLLGVAAGGLDKTLKTHFGETAGRISANATVMENSFNRSEKSRPNTASLLDPLINELRGFTSDDSKLGTALSGTEENTHRTAVATEKIADFSRNALGGGNLGAMGVTPVEIRAHQSQRPNFNVPAGKLGEALREIAETIYNQRILDAVRAGGR